MGTAKDKNGAKSAAKLRRQAEDSLNTNSPESVIAPPVTETERLLHELQVHQIELEMQNSELRQARADLETALEKYTVLYNFAPVGYFTFNCKGVISAVNLTGASMLGKERSRLLGRRFGLFLTEESRPLFSEFLGKVFATRSKTSCEVTLTTEENIPLIVQIDADVFGSGQECHAALIDITERRKAEVSLRRSEALYRAIGESIDYGIWVCAPDGRNIYASDSFLQMVGITREQCADFGWGEVLHPDDAEQTVAAWKECVRTGGTWDREHRYRGADGQWHPVLARGVPVRDEQGAVTCWAGINLDISYMKKAERKLRDSEERLLLALSAAQLATWDWRLQSGVIIWNDAHYRMLGYEPGTVTPSYRAWVERMHPDDIVATEAKIRECMATGSVYISEFRVLWPDGTVHWLEARGEFKFDDAGQPFRNYGVMIDRTSQKQVEAALQQAYNELIATNIELEAFNYTVSHDLRTPLTLINGYCQMVLDLSDSILDEHCRGYIKEIYDGSLRMTRLIETLLDFSSITRIEMRHDKVDLSKMAEEVAMVLKVSDPGRRVTFRIADGITVDGDAVLLQSALNNLMGNAWKYSGNRENVVIEFGATQIDGKSACYVKDNGPGFAREHLDKLFLPFQRLPGTKVEGHGIGLATVDRIIRRHGGRVWAEVDPGKGVCFYFTLGAD
mgnify:CR=1 FL=1